MDSDMFATTPPTRLFFRCALPEVVTAVFGALYSVVDGLFVGRFLGEDALAAVNLIMPVIMIIEAISNMIATGASVQMSVLLGKGNREKASRVFSFSIKFILAFSLGFYVMHKSWQFNRTAGTCFTPKNLNVIACLFSAGDVPKTGTSPSKTP